MKQKSQKHWLPTIVLASMGFFSIAHAQTPKAYTEPHLMTQSALSFSGPADLAITPDGSYLLVADTGNNEIKVLQPGTLKIISQFGNDSLRQPHSLEFAEDGLLLVADSNNTRVTVFRFEGVFRDGRANVKQIEVQSVAADTASGPATTTDANGLVYVVNGAKNQILIFDRHHNQISAYGADHLSSPNAVETVGRYFWIADTGNNRILLLKAPHPETP